MKNKILAAVLVIILSAGQVQAGEKKKEKDPFQIMSGGFLVAAGALVAYSGFYLVNVSQPGMRMQSFTWSTSGTWDVVSNGTILNSGNMDLRNISITVEYKDGAGALIDQQTVTPDTKALLLKSGETDTFSSSINGLGADPRFVSAKFTADFTGESVNAHVPTGAVGAAVAAIGVFFICDYFLNITDFFLKQEIQVQLSALDGGFSLITSKSF